MIPDQQLRRSDIQTAQKVMRKHGISEAELARRLQRMGVKISQPAIYFLFHKTPKNPKKPTRNQLATALQFLPELWKYADIGSDGAAGLIDESKDANDIWAAKFNKIPLLLNPEDMLLVPPREPKDSLSLDYFLVLFEALYQCAHSPQSKVLSVYAWGMMYGMIHEFMKAMGTTPKGYKGPFPESPDDQRAQEEAIIHMRRLASKMLALQGEWSEANRKRWKEKQKQKKAKP